MNDWKEATAEYTSKDRFIDLTIKNNIDITLLDRNKKRDKNHKSSGKLSASMLGYPLQWQVLKKIKAPKVSPDGQGLRRMLRGVMIEDWLTEITPALIDKQVLCEYKGAVGYLDMLVDHTFYEFKASRVAHEVKSVTRDKLRWITKTGKPDDAHLLQGAFYALALGLNNFAIDYVTTDDMEVVTYIEKTSDYKNRIDKIIGAYNYQLALGKIPIFEAVYPWQEKPEYNIYPDWVNLTEEEIEIKKKKMEL